MVILGLNIVFLKLLYFSHNLIASFLNLLELGILLQQQLKFLLAISKLMPPYLRLLAKAHIPLIPEPLQGSGMLSSLCGQHALNALDSAVQIFLVLLEFGLEGGHLLAGLFVGLRDLVYLFD
jgi:hypothetical protein